MRTKIYLIGILFTTFLLLSACKSETAEKIKSAKESVNQAKDLVKNVKNIEKTTKDLEKRVEELKKITPFDNEKFKSWMPEKLGDMERSSFTFQTSSATSGTLEFKNGAGDKSMRITITDGAGEAGAAIYTFQGFMTGLAKGFESEYESKTEQIKQREGSQSLETYYKKDNNSGIKTTVDERFMVDAEGENMNPDELWSLIVKLNVNKLK